MLDSGVPGYIRTKPSRIEVSERYSQLSLPSAQFRHEHSAEVDINSLHSLQQTISYDIAVTVDKNKIILWKRRRSPFVTVSHHQGELSDVCQSQRPLLCER